MGCSPAVSTTILGNDGAAAIYGTKGALIINTNANEDKNKEKMLGIEFRSHQTMSLQKLVQVS